MMRPRYEEVSSEAEALLKKAQYLAERAAKLEKSAQPHYEQTFSTKPEGMHFVSETGGQTKSAGYSTNGHLLDVEDVANKGAMSSSFNVEELAKRMNAHQTGTQDRDVSTDNKQPDRD
jgi:hypothetical protein